MCNGVQLKDQQVAVALRAAICYLKHTREAFTERRVGHQAKWTNGRSRCRSVLAKRVLSASCTGRHRHNAPGECAALLYLVGLSAKCSCKRLYLGIWSSN